MGDSCFSALAAFVVPLSKVGESRKSRGQGQEDGVTSTLNGADLEIQESAV